jgi:hypothetical protein
MVAMSIFLHRHHRFEGTPCLIATSRERIGEHARGCPSMVTIAFQR